jgi:aspartate racemase
MLIGGMSWEPTVSYYRCINELVTQHLGGLHSARIICVVAGQSDRYEL